MNVQGSNKVRDANEQTVFSCAGPLYRMTSFRATARAWKVLVKNPTEFRRLKAGWCQEDQDNWSPNALPTPNSKNRQPLPSNGDKLLGKTIPQSSLQDPAEAGISFACHLPFCVWFPPSHLPMSAGSTSFISLRHPFSSQGNISGDPH